MGGTILIKKYKILGIVGFSLTLVILIGYFSVAGFLNLFHQAGTIKADIGEFEENELIIDGHKGSIKEDGDQDDLKTIKTEIEKEEDAYRKMVQDSSRINIVCLGIAQNLTDTIIVASVDPVQKRLDLISVPRDTYLYRPGYEQPGQKKINASYVGSNGTDRAQSSMNAARDVLQIPIHHFVAIEYKGVEEIVNALKGIEVYIPFDMEYDDFEDGLHIRFQQGKKVLNGADAVKYLRFRKNNDNSYSDGDIGRIKRQQDFVVQVLKKSFGVQMLQVVNIGRNYIRTSMIDKEMLGFLDVFMQMDMNQIHTYLLPGESGYINRTSYYIQSKQKTQELITEIYTMP